MADMDLTRMLRYAERWDRSASRRAINTDMLIVCLGGGTFSDRIFSTDDGKEIKAHRAYLSRSRYFRNAFTSHFKEAHNKGIELSEVHWVLSLVLRAVYLPIDDREDQGANHLNHNLLAFGPLSDLTVYKTADKYMLSVLKTIAQDIDLAKVKNALDTRNSTRAEPDPGRESAITAFAQRIRELDKLDDFLRQPIVGMALQNPGCASFQTQVVTVKTAMLKWCPKSFRHAQQPALV